MCAAGELAGQLRVPPVLNVPTWINRWFMFRPGTMDSLNMDMAIGFKPNSVQQDIWENFQGLYYQCRIYSSLTGTKLKDGKPYHFVISIIQ